MLSRVSRPCIAVALALVLALALGACSKHASAKLEGRWRGQRVEGVSADVQASADAFATGTEIIAKGNQIAFSTPTQKGLQASFTVESDDKSTVVLRTDKGDGPQTLAFSDDGRTMTWQVDDKRRVVFQRQP